MKNIIVKDFENIRLVFENLKKDKKHLKVSIYLKEDITTRIAEDVEVYVEIGSEKRQSLKLQKDKNSDIWQAAVKIENTVSSVYSFDKDLAVKFVQSKVLPCRSSYPQAS